MSRWICIDDICIPSDENDWEELVAFADAIAEQDPMELIRCRECKYAHMTYGGECKYCDKWSLEDSLYLDGDFFCSYGEREGE